MEKGGGGGGMGAIPTSSLSVELLSYRRKIWLLQFSLKLYLIVAFQAAIFVAYFGHYFL